MKYARAFDNTSLLIEEMDEIIINYAKNASLIKSYITNHPQNRIIVNYVEPEISPQFIVDILDWKKEGLNNFSILLAATTITPSFKQTVQEAGIPFFFSFAVDTWDMLHSYIAEGVSDIYISGQLGFELDKVRTAAKGVSIRVIPNVAQRDLFGHVPALKSFFVRPEDIEFYEPYVDVFELRGPHDKIDNIYEIYQKGRWYGNLNELIIGFDEDFDSKFVVELFGHRRVSCQKKCLKGQRCRICDSIANLAKTLEANDYYIPPKRKKDNDAETKNT